MKYLVAVIFLGSLCLGSSPVFAQGFSQNTDTRDDKSIRWWQVEVIIFTNDNSSTYSSEIWPTDVELSYPNQWQELLPFNDPSLELPIEPANDIDTAAQTLSNNSPVDDNGLSVENEKPTYDNSKTLYLIPEEEHQLADTHRGLGRNGRRRVLFHQAWRQSMEQNKDEEAILITGGDQFDDHYELEGSIKIYWQRLLHFDTNLWLSEFSINAGQEREAWPELPTRPNIEIPLSRMMSLDQIGSTSLGGFSTDNGNGSNTDVNNPARNNTFSDNNFRNPGLTNTNQNMGQINSLEWLDQRGNTTFYDSRYDEILSRSYVVNNLVQMKQNRPMRSSELHYLDHPQLGILVQITPYEEPEIEEMEELIDQPIE